MMNGDEVPQREEALLYDQSEGITTRKRKKSLIAGALLIIAGCLSILTWISLATIDVTFIENILTTVPDTTSFPLTPEALKDMFIICGTIGFFLSLITILGGVMAIRKQWWGIAVAGAIIGLFTIGPIFLSSILSLVSLILLITSKSEFL
jgi:hypothetical protein